MKKSLQLYGLAAVSCLWIQTVRGAETLGVVPDSAQALSTIGGRAANLQDPTTVRTSPANMLYAERPEFLMNTSLWNGGSTLHSAAGFDLESGDPWKTLASMYTVVPIVPGRVAFGIGVTAPYGLDSNYPRDGAFGYLVAYDAKLLTLDITPAIAVKVTDSLSLGLGLDIMYSRLTLKQIFPWRAVTGNPADADGEIQMDGDGWGIGAYAGVNWEVAKGHRLAVTGRLPLTVRYDGSFTTRGMPAGLGAAGFQQRSDFNSDITFPATVLAGYGVDVTERLTLGFDFQWSQNSTHDDIPLNIRQNQALIGATGVALDWRDSIDLGTGISYQLNERWVARLGYRWSENTQAEANYTPGVPSNEHHTMSGGLGWQGKNNSFDFAYAYVFFEDRYVNAARNPAFNGNYENKWHVFTMSWTHRF